MSDTIAARAVLGLTTDELWATYNRPKFRIAVEFEDGVVETTGRELLFSQYFWDFHRAYPNTPLRREHLMDPTRRLNKNTSLELIGRGLWSVWDTYNGQVSLDALQRLAYLITNNVYNEIVRRMPEYVTSIDALHIVEVLEHPEIVEAITNALPTQSSIANVSKVVQSVLRREGELVGNRPAESAKSDLVSAGQQNQIFGIRGFVTDIDSNVFRKPIMTGYGRGFHKLHDYAVESRSASKALFFAKDPLAEVEYLNRQLQLLAQSLRHLFKGDCGSTVTLPLFVKSKADLKTLEGKYYHYKGEFCRITTDDNWLVGQHVNVRTPLGCKCLPHQGVCQACLGEIALQIPENANLGHLSVIELCSGVSQNVLSTKHHDASSVIEAFHIAEGDRGFLAPGKKDNQIALAAALTSREAVLILSQAEAYNLTELKHVKDLTLLPITRVCELEAITIRCKALGGGDDIELSIPIAVGSRKASLTTEFLAFVKRTGWTATADRGYEIKLTGWDFSKPVFELPLRNINTMEFMAEVADIIKFKRLRRRRSKQAKEMAMETGELAALVTELHDTVNKRFTYNIAHCELILAVCLIRDAKALDFRFPGPDDPREFAPFKELMSNRSMSQTYAFEKHSQTILSLDSFVNTTPPSHPMDRIYVPEG